MIRVTTDRGEIWADDKVVATVPKGTRMWCFEFSDGEWADVMVPGRNLRGWLGAAHFKAIEHTKAEQARLDESVKHYDRAVELVEKMKFTEAERELKACLAIEREIEGSDHPDVGYTLSYLGNVCFSQARYTEARKHYDEALAIFRRVFGDDDLDTASTLIDLGFLVSGQGDYASARKFFEEALATSRSVAGDESVETADGLGNLGTLAQQQGDYAGARRYFDEALATYRKVDEGVEGLDASKGALLHNLANLLLEQGDYATARKYYEDSLAISRKLYGKEHTEVAHSLNNIGLLLASQEDYTAAKKYYEEALAIYRKVYGNEHPDTAMTLDNLAISLGYLGDLNSAQTYSQQALVVRRRILGDNHPDTATSLEGLGFLLYERKDYAAAQRYYDEALAIRRKTFGEAHPYVGMVLHNLAWLKACSGELDLAGEYMEAARKNTCRHQAQVLPALPEREQLLFISETDEGNLHRCLSFASQQRDDNRIAALSAGWLVNGKAIAQQALAEGALLSASETAPLVERLRAVRSLLAKLVGKPFTANIQQGIAGLETEQQQLIRQIGAAGTGFSGQDPWISIAQLRGELRPGSALVNIARIVPHKLDDPVFNPTERPAVYIAWVIPASDEGPVTIVDLGDAETIDLAVQKARSAMQNSASAIEEQGERSATAMVNDELATLANSLWKPLASHLKGKKELVLSPDGALWLVPWAAIPAGDNKFLLEKFQLRFVTSGRELVQRRPERTGIGPPVVLADPDYDWNAMGTSVSSRSATHRAATIAGPFARLPGTAREARAIEPVLAEFGKGQPVIYLEKRATETQFKSLYRPSFLVCSTHGFFLEDQNTDESDAIPKSTVSAAANSAKGPTKSRPLENPLLRCGLVLSGVNRQTEKTSGDDGVLTGLEIVSTDLRGTEMVVLSACDTGVGDVRNGEGVAGLRQAFQLAGAKSVVATLWQIPDQETSQIMTDFFVYLGQGRSKAEALRYAQINRINDHRNRTGAAHPYYWAAFTITGNQ
ncbi:CHAT domain-containing tetratricopeptide repeat protein [Posidoniimonas polymericola]|nr:tetratricopeptide repeat protein [Posidoniimonas polymericola]